MGIDSIVKAIRDNGYTPEKPKDVIEEGLDVQDMIDKFGIQSEFNKHNIPNPNTPFRGDGMASRLTPRKGDTSEYSKYIPISRINLASPNIDETRARNQTGGQLFKAASSQIVVGHILGGTLEHLGYMLDLPSWYKNWTNSEQEWGRNWLSDIGHTFKDWAMTTGTPIHQTRRAMEGGIGGMTDRTWWMSHLPSTFTSLSLMLPIFGAVRGVSALGKALNIGGKWSMLAKSRITTVGSAMASRHMYSTTESVDNYKQHYQHAKNVLNLNEQDSKKYASRSAAHNYRLGWMNIWKDMAAWGMLMRYPAMSNAMLRGKLDKGLLKRGSKFDTTTEAGKLATAKKLADPTKPFKPVHLLYHSLLEGFEEYNIQWQKKEGKRVADKALGFTTDSAYNDIRDRIIEHTYDPHTFDSFFWGAAGGLLFGIFGRVGTINAYKTQVQREAAELQRLNNQAEFISAEINNIVNFIEAGDEYSAELSRGKLIAGLTLTGATAGTIGIDIAYLENLSKLSDQELQDLGYTREAAETAKELSKEVQDAANLYDSIKNKSFGYGEQDAYIVGHLFSNELQRKYAEQIRAKYVNKRDQLKANSIEVVGRELTPFGVTRNEISNQRRVIERIIKRAEKDITQHEKLLDSIRRTITNAEGNVPINVLQLEQSLPEHIERLKTDIEGYRTDLSAVTTKLSDLTKTEQEALKEGVIKQQQLDSDTEIISLSDTSELGDIENSIASIEKTLNETAAEISKVYRNKDYQKSIIDNIEARKAEAEKKSQEDLENAIKRATKEEALSILKLHPETKELVNKRVAEIDKIEAEKIANENMIDGVTETATPAVTPEGTAPKSMTRAETLEAIIKDLEAEIKGEIADNHAELLNVLLDITDSLSAGKFGYAETTEQLSITSEHLINQVEKAKELLSQFDQNDPKYAGLVALVTYYSDQQSAQLERVKQLQEQKEKAQTPHSNNPEEKLNKVVESLEDFQKVHDMQKTGKPIPVVPDGTKKALEHKEATKIIVRDGRELEVTLDEKFVFIDGKKYELGTKKEVTNPVVEKDDGSDPITDLFGKSEVSLATVSETGIDSTIERFHSSITDYVNMLLQDSAGEVISVDTVLAVLRDKGDRSLENLYDTVVLLFGYLRSMDKQMNYSAKFDLSQNKYLQLGKQGLVEWIKHDNILRNTSFEQGYVPTTNGVYIYLRELQGFHHNLKYLTPEQASILETIQDEIDTNSKVAFVIAPEHKDTRFSDKELAERAKNKDTVPVKIVFTKKDGTKVDLGFLQTTGTTMNNVQYLDANGNYSHFSSLLDHSYNGINRYNILLEHLEDLKAIHLGQKVDLTTKSRKALREVLNELININREEGNLLKDDITAIKHVIHPFFYGISAPLLHQYNPSLLKLRDMMNGHVQRYKKDIDYTKRIREKIVDGKLDLTGSVVKSGTPGIKYSAKSNKLTDTIKPIDLGDGLGKRVIVARRNLRSTDNTIYDVVTGEALKISNPHVLAKTTAGQGFFTILEYKKGEYMAHRLDAGTVGESLGTYGVKATEQITIIIRNLNKLLKEFYIDSTVTEAELRERKKNLLDRLEKVIPVDNYRYFKVNEFIHKKQFNITFTTKEPAYGLVLNKLEYEHGKLILRKTIKSDNTDGRGNIVFRADGIHESKVIEKVSDLAPTVANMIRNIPIDSDSNKLKATLNKKYNDSLTGTEYNNYFDYLVDTGALSTKIDSFKNEKTKEVVSNFNPSSTIKGVMFVKPDFEGTVIDSNLKKKASTVDSSKIETIEDYISMLPESGEYGIVFELAKQLGIKLNVEIAKEDKRNAENRKQNATIEGNTVTFYPDTFNRSTQHQTLTVVHEMLHGIAEHKLSTLTVAQREKFNNRITEYLSDISEAAKITNLTKLEKERFDIFITEANKHKDEAITFAFTNPYIAPILAKLEFKSSRRPSKSFWVQLQDIILELLGITDKGAIKELVGILNETFKVSEVTEISKQDQNVQPVETGNDISGDFTVIDDGKAPVKKATTARPSDNVTTLKDKLNAKRERLRNKDSKDIKSEIDFTTDIASLPYNEFKNRFRDAEFKPIC
jgi:hypothetical protein